ncbi:MAG: g-type lysozyme inhibitor [Sulfurospirillum sp.]|nr:MAG: g-type lysozyme inhibitor [Sulfurospirillum sp.]
MRTKLYAAALGLVLLGMPAVAKDKITTHQVHFQKGTSSATMKGSVKGYDTVLYKLGAKAGQTMRVSIDSKHANFNVYAPGKGMGDQALFLGEPGIPYVGKLPADGTYTISVYLMRNEARRGTTAPFTLHAEVK